MIKSMTGYGQAEFITPEVHYKFDIKSVNHKKLEIYGTLPIFLQNMENDIRRFISDKIKRGKVNFYLKVIHWERNSDIFLDKTKLEKISSYIEDVNKDLETRIELDFRSIMTIPEVFSISDDSLDRDQVLPLLEPTIHQALDSLIVSRESEGKFLKEDIDGSLSRIETILENVISLKDKATEELKKNFEAKITKLLKEYAQEIDKSKLYQELAYLIDKADIQEEIVRLKSHIDQFRNTVKEHETPGKFLNFLLQEMNREANTLGVKCGYLPIIRENLIIKEEIEKIREQVQNIE